MKIGATIEGKKTELTKGGRQLLKLANKENIIILNNQRKVQRSMDKSEGRRKVYNYAITVTTSANTIKEMKTDEEKTIWIT